jgi:hypothetical protein
MFLVRHWRNMQNDRAVQAFNDAVAYLTQHSQLAADLIGDLRGSDKAIEVLVSFDEPAARDNGWIGPVFDRGNSGGTVTWNAARAKALGKPSAALGLMHELGHVHQFLSEKAGAKAILRPVFGRFYRMRPEVFHSDEFLDKFEETNVAAIELMVANEINAALGNAAPEALEPTREHYRKPAVH